MTLVELLVVLVILSIVASMSAATLRWRTSSPAADPHAEMRTAAIRTGRVVTSCDSLGACTTFLPDGRIVTGQPASLQSPI